VTYERARVNGETRKEVREGAQTMRKKKYIIRILVPLGLLICLFTLAIPALAFQYYGYHWDSDHTYYNASSLPDEWIWAIYLAATEWNSAGADFRFYGSDSCGNTITRGYYGDELWLAETTIYASGYHIYEVDTVFNTRYTWYTDGRDYDVQHTATHEFGHWLSLGHTYDSDAVMYFYYNGVRELSQDDIDGIIHIYGAE